MAKTFTSTDENMTKKATQKLHVVRFFVDDDGEAVNDDFWHWVDEGNRQGASKFCTKEFFGFGESTAEYETAEGQITCPLCIATLRIYKATAIKAGI